jgi:lysyl-tRNA synthetase class 1
MTDPALIDAALDSKAWPFQEAQRLLRRYPDGSKPDGSPVLFETGYGPSGLPHIGTFQEVLRTTFVRRAFETLIGARPEDGKTRLVAFSDDMDGLRKVPDNVPNHALLEANLGRPLSRVPDPFDAGFDSFAAHNNAQLREFLDRFGFDYEFVSASSRYNSGGFDDALRQVLRKNQAILDIMLPTLREERRRTYSPILPISPSTGRVLQVPVEILDAEAGTIRFTDEDGGTIEQSALGGQAKLQWKVDWAMRWYALGVNYEMYGKDLTDSGVQSGKIVEVLGGRKPEGLIYELFLDEKGEKISKSKGNGLTIEEWLRYGTPESLGFYIFPNPKSAKSLHAGVIPRAVDDYWQFRAQLAEQPVDKQLGNPAWHLLRANGDSTRVPAEAEAPIGGTRAPPASTGEHVSSNESLPVTYSLLLNLIGVLGAGASAEQVWSYLANYVPGARADAHPELAKLVEGALAYNRDLVAPTLVRRAPESNEADALRELDYHLARSGGAGADELQSLVYDIGKREEYGFASLRDWFKALYQTLLGSDQGPRMGSFIALYGIPATRRLIADALARPDY